MLALHKVGIYERLRRSTPISSFPISIGAGGTALEHLDIVSTAARVNFNRGDS